MNVLNRAQEYSDSPQFMEDQRFEDTRLPYMITPSFFILEPTGYGAIIGCPRHVAEAISVEQRGCPENGCSYLRPGKQLQAPMQCLVEQAIQL